MKMLSKINTTFFRSGKSTPRIHTPEIADCTFHQVEDWTYERVFNALWGLYCIDPSADVSLYDHEGKKIPLEPGEVCLIPANTPFSTQMRKKGPIFSVNFSTHGFLESVERRIYTFPAALLREELPKLLHSSDPEDMLLRIQRIVCGYLAKIDPETFYLNGKNPNMDERVAFAVKYIENHLSEPLKIRQISQKLQISQMTLQRIFLRDIHKTPKQFQSDLRQQQAIHLLRHTEKTLDEIALELGYSNRCQFSGAFRKSRAMPPGEYRKNFSLSQAGEERSGASEDRPSVESLPEKCFFFTGKNRIELPGFEWKQFKTGKNMLPVIPVSIQCLDHEPNPDQEGVMEESSQWQILCVSGRGARISFEGGNPLGLSGKYCCLIPSRVRYRIHGRAPLRICTVSFWVCEELEALKRDVYRFESDEFFKTLKDLERHSGELIYCQLLLQSLICHCLTRIPRSRFIPAWKNLDPRIMRVVQQISADPGGGLQIGQLCKSVHMSGNSFRALFKKELGMTPRLFIRDQKLLYVEKLLTQTDLKLSEIALKSGFSDAFALSKFFVREEKIPPMRYRSLYGNGSVPDEINQI